MGGNIKVLIFLMVLICLYGWSCSSTEKPADQVIETGDDGAVTDGEETGGGGGTTPEVADACITSGTEKEIQDALISDNSEAVLCPNSTFSVTKQIRFTHSGQKIYTKGNPTDDSRAVLTITADTLTTAITGLNIDDITISNVIIDGGRSTLGYLSGDAMIEIGGNATGQVVEHVKAFDTRSWSILHLFEGSKPSCRNATIRYNEIGPAGTDDATQWADGISFACRDSLVADNIITNATDCGIAVFSAPGSLIENNDINAVDRELLGGICMSDGIAFEGDSTGIIVRGNSINAEGATIRIGLSMGERVWGCRETYVVLVGATVTENILSGDFMQYGYAVSGVEDWSVTGNIDEATHSGTAVSTCKGETPADPKPFLLDPDYSTGIFQPEFETGNLDLALWAAW